MSVNQVLSEYEQKAVGFLAAHNLTFSAVLLGDDCPPFCEDAAADRDMDKVNEFPRRTHIHGKHYRCTFQKTTTSGQAAKVESFTMDFWNSYHDESINWAIRHRNEYRFKEHYQMGKDALRVGRKIQTPTAYDVLAAITKSDPGTFNNFCDEYGYDSDSRKAEDTYRAVVKEWEKVRKFFTAEQIEQLQEIA